MGYPIDLDELADEVLHNELRRRQQLRSQGLCSYCKQPLSEYGKPAEKQCKIHEVRAGAVGETVLVKRRGDIS